MGIGNGKCAEERERDVRVIVLDKALELSARSIGASNGHMISFGYFDSIQFENLDKAHADIYKGFGCGEAQVEKSWLSKAWEYSVVQSGNCLDQGKEMIYNHPLYVVAYSPGTDENQHAAWRQKIEEFWQADRFFYFVTFVHFSISGNNQDFDSFEAREVQITRALQTPESPLDGSEGDVPEVLCYHSMDLSDMVVIWKTNRLPEALKRIEKLHRERIVGDLHTICSFRRDSDMEKSKEFLKSPIPYVSFRFGVRDSTQMEKLDDLIVERYKGWKNFEKFITIGTEDLNVVGRDVPIQDVVKLLRMWVENEQVNALFKEVYNDSSTRIGTQKSAIVRGESHAQRNTKLEEKCKDIAQEFNIARTNLNQKQVDLSYSWVKAVSEQMKTFVSMSRLRVLDGFCYLMMQSVKKFCSRLNPILKGNGQMPSSTLKDIHQFIRSWGTLMEQAVRADGQFTANLGINPTLYHIPIGVMECDMAFLHSCMSFIRNAEGTEQRTPNTEQCALFLMPRLCRRVKVDALLSGASEEEDLLYIEIPLEYLYNQKVLLPQLCHEISHYVGEICRCRKERAEAYLWCSAALIALYFDRYEKKVTDAIYQSLMEKTEFGTEEGRKKLRYMREMKEYILCAVCDCLKDNEVIRTWEQVSQYGNSRNRLKVEDFKVEKFGQAFAFVGELFRECYADLAMIDLLQLEYAEYLDFYARELKCAADITWNSLAQRAALTRYVAWPDKGSPAYETDENSKEFDMYVEQIFDNIKEGDQMYGTLPIEILQRISLYLNACHQTLKKKTGQSELEEERKTIRDIYDALVRRTDLAADSICGAVKKYEQSILEETTADGLMVLS